MRFCLTSASLATEMRRKFCFQTPVRPPTGISSKRVRSPERRRRLLNLLRGNQVLRVDRRRRCFESGFDHVKRAGDHEIALATDASSQAKLPQLNFGSLESRI